MLGFDSPTISGGSPQSRQQSRASASLTVTSWRAATMGAARKRRKRQAGVGHCPPEFTVHKVGQQPRQGGAAGDHVRVVLKLRAGAVWHQAGVW